MTTVERAGRRPRDMALSMLVLIVPVFLLVGFYRFLGHEDPPSIDTSEVYGSVQRTGQFTALKPEHLPPDWRITSATFTDGVLRLGVTAPHDGALQVVESAQAPAALVASALGNDAKAAETVTLNGAGWQRYAGGRPGEDSLVLATSGRTVIVLGRSSTAQLQQLASTLR